MSDLPKLIEAHLAGIGGPCYTVKVPAQASTYVVLYPTPGLVTPEQYSGAHSDQVEELRVMCVSDDPNAVLRYVARVRDRLTGWNPRPTDTSQSPLYETDSGPVLPSGPEQQPLFSTTLVYRAHRRRKAHP